ncbi:hypothetical protein B0H10DRAFT_2101879 [Mycena sp. CBHHK59/15]|nr:hypothetical protein B0H10DRAFT_2101879 [Mycena sp. CBHHK59/15]
MSGSATVVQPASVLGKRSRASSHLVLHLASSPEPCGHSDSDFDPSQVASTSKSHPILVAGILPSRLEEHERSHSGLRPFVCEKCKKSYLRETHLHAHARSHLPKSDRPFVCTAANCDKRFWTAQHLRVHTEWHNGAKPFVCSESNCQEAFAKHHQLRAHKCSVHAAPGTKPYQCDHEGCTQSFATNQHLRTHSRVHNEKRYTCAHLTCLATNGETIKFYPNWTALQHHNRTVHPPTCSHPSCDGRVFSSQKGLRAHQKLHEERAAEADIDAAVAALDSEDADDEPPRKKRRGGELGRDWRCAVDSCTKDFKSKKALKTHTNVVHLGRRDHICPHEDCKQAFGYKHLLQRHVAKHHASSSASSGSWEEDAHVSMPSTSLGIDLITGNAYAQNAREKLKAAKVLRCPYPHLNDVAVVHEHGNSSATCDYVFSRAYDLRRHLQTVHEVVAEKESVDRWRRTRK